MAHNLTINQFGQTEFFYVHESPWHRLGTRLEQVATSAQALAAAHLITEWVDHVRGVAESGPRPNREEHALFGKGDEIKRRAFSRALDMLG